MKILESDPKHLASLIGDEDIGERIWQPNELAAILKHQLTTPLHVDLEGLSHGSRRRRSAQKSPAEGAEKSAPTDVGGYDDIHAVAEARGLLLKSFGDLLQHAHPPVALLKLMKAFFRFIGMSV